MTGAPQPAASATPVSAGSALTPVTSFLRRHAPFDRIAGPALDAMAVRLDLVFYAAGDLILSPADGPPDRLFIIKQGRVRGELDAAGGAGEAWELTAGECFSVGALLSRRPVRLAQRAAEDTFCYELDREGFDTLLAESPEFNDFCTRRLAALLDNALKRAQTRSATRVSEDSLNTPLGTLVRRAPVTCGPDTAIGEVLATLQRERVGSIAVVERGHLLGIFTLKDLLARVVLPERDRTDPIRTVMTPDPVTLAPDVLACEAARFMAQRGFTHILVAHEGRLAGVLSERDLFALQRVGLVSLARAIAHSPTVEALAHVEHDVHRVIEQMLAQGASVEQLTQILTALNDSVAQRVIALVLQAHGAPGVACAWLAFGSEGRFEQTLKTDQDNGLLFRVPAGESAASVRARLLPLAQRINAALAVCGFPLCESGMMAGNETWCLSVAEWQARFEAWSGAGAADAARHARALDFRAVWGDEPLAAELRGWLAARAAKARPLIDALALDALRNAPPLAVENDEAPQPVDLKRQGTAPFVDAARVLAIAHGIEETHTVRRLHAVARSGALRVEDARAWGEAYHFLQLLRLRQRRRRHEAGEPPDERLDPATLDELDRRILKEAFRQLRKLQSVLRQRYAP